EIDLGAVDQCEALLVHHDLDAVVLEHDVAGLDLVGIVHDVRIAVAAGPAHAHAQPDAFAPLAEEVANPFRRRFRQFDRHGRSWSRFPAIRSLRPHGERRAVVLYEYGAP